MHYFLFLYSFWIVTDYKTVKQNDMVISKTYLHITSPLIFKYIKRLNCFVIFSCCCCCWLAKRSQNWVYWLEKLNWFWNFKKKIGSAFVLLNLVQKFEKKNHSFFTQILQLTKFSHKTISATLSLFSFHSSLLLYLQYLNVLKSTIIIIINFSNSSSISTRFIYTKFQNKVENHRSQCDLNTHIGKCVSLLMSASKLVVYLSCFKTNLKAYGKQATGICAHREINTYKEVKDRMKNNLCKYNFFFFLFPFFLNCAYVPDWIDHVSRLFLLLHWMWFAWIYNSLSWYIYAFIRLAGVCLHQQHK